MTKANPLTEGALFLAKLCFAFAVASLFVTNSVAKWRASAPRKPEPEAFTYYTWQGSQFAVSKATGIKYLATRKGWTLDSAGGR